MPRKGRDRAGIAQRNEPGLRERKKARLRQQIVETALHLFRQRGYENTRIDDICKPWRLASRHFFAIFQARMRCCAKWAAGRLPGKPKA
jgi:hypothetical protein